MSSHWPSTMKITRDQVLLTLIYVLGLNLYYALWYLGSEGQALDWGEPGLDFWAHWIAGNMASLLNASILMSLINAMDQKRSHLEMPRMAPLILGISLLAFAVLFSLVLTLQALVFSATSILPFFSSMALLSVLFFHLVVASLMMLLHLVVIKSGSLHVFFKQLFAKKRVARPVNRGFAFIDMNRSTDLAALLGHRAYSELVSNCFDQLEEIMSSYPRVEVYQYVGDEAIITWQVESADSENAMKVFKEFSEGLEKRRTDLMNKYGHFPEFKCAIHSGEVTESELGYKSPQKAYHGDVLNMASRILGLCHHYQTSLLISEAYRQLLGAQYRKPMVAIKHEFVNGRSRKMLLYKPLEDQVNGLR